MQPLPAVGRAFVALTEQAARRREMLGLAPGCDVVCRGLRCAAHTMFAVPLLCRGADSAALACWLLKSGAHGAMAGWGGRR